MRPHSSDRRSERSRAGDPRQARSTDDDTFAIRDARRCERQATRTPVELTRDHAPARPPMHAGVSDAGAVSSGPSGRTTTTASRGSVCRGAAHASVRCAVRGPPRRLSSGLAAWLGCSRRGGEPRQVAPRGQHHPRSSSCETHVGPSVLFHSTRWWVRAAEALEPGACIITLANVIRLFNIAKAIQKDDV